MIPLRPKTSLASFSTAKFKSKKARNDDYLTNKQALQHENYLISYETRRKYLFNSYMKQLKEAIRVLKDKEHELDENDIKNATQDIRDLNEAMEREKVEAKTFKKETKLKTKIEKKTEEKEEMTIETIEKAVDLAHSLQKAVKKFKTKNTRPVEVESDIEAPIEIVENSQQVKIQVDLNALNLDEDQREADLLEVSLHSIISNEVATDRNTSSRSVHFDLDKIQKKENNFYQKNKKLFMTSNEKALKAFYSYSRLAEKEVNRMIPCPERPKFHSIDFETHPNKAVKLLDLQANRKKLDHKIADWVSSDESDSDIEDYYKDYIKKLKKRENYMSLVTIMFKKSLKNQTKFEKFMLNKQKLNINQGQKSDESHRPHVKTPTEFFSRESTQTPKQEIQYTKTKPSEYRISISNTRPLTNYEVFIPKRPETSMCINRITSPMSISSSNSSTKRMNGEGNNLNSNKNLPKNLSLSFNSLKDKFKTIEPKVKSAYWKNIEIY